ncbi:MAG: hypothetical protein ONB46_07045 [candidate division KSB1 bacterium]|nr:hypothetical protein [candidate division KSB1 bacterium]MDZ7368276.1 hypothetical protein [candidate division KSB1 bacterium]MDZ7406144.1 hypothetical protein [candidate division KSB1 bacterium]
MKSSFLILMAVLVAILTVLGTMVVSPVAAADDVKITGSAFVYKGIRYFRAKSENVDLGSYGEKKTPLTQANYLAVQNKVKADNLAKINVNISGPYSIDWAKFSSTDVNAGINYLKAGGATAAFSHDAAKKADLKLVKIYINEGPLKTLLNNHADGARNYMADEGDDARIASEIWVAMEAELASQITNDFNITGEASSGGFTVEFSASTSSTKKSTITIPPNTTFAYLLHKVTKWSNNKTKVEDMEDDQQSLN